MAKKKTNVFDFNLKEDLTSNDLAKIQIAQNHTIIKLLSLQTQNTVQTLFNMNAMDWYENKISPFIDRSNKVLRIPENLEGRKKIQYNILKGRLDAGEDIRKAAEDLNLYDYFDFD